jgi:signal peptidase I
VRDGWLIGAAGAALFGLAVVVVRRRLLVVEVIGDSMAPVYRPGDRLLVRRSRRMRTGDVVIAHHQDGGRRTGRGPGTAWLVKRLVAQPGEPVPDSVVAAAGGVRVVPAGMTVLLGEHPESADSRIWGLIPAGDVAGVVTRRIASARR